MPTPELRNPKPRGIYGKYTIEKADGSKIDPEACYFVLRLDTDRAARKAMGQYARSVRRENPELADQIERCLNELDEPQPRCNCREAMCPHERIFSDVWQAGEA